MVDGEGWTQGRSDVDRVTWLVDIQYAHSYPRQLPVGFPGRPAHEVYPDWNHAQPIVDERDNYHQCLSVCPKSS
jgi:hypothetical protein